MARAKLTDKITVEVRAWSQYPSRHEHSELWWADVTYTIPKGTKGSDLKALGYLAGEHYGDAVCYHEDMNSPGKRHVVLSMISPLSLRPDHFKIFDEQKTQIVQDRGFPSLEYPRF